MSDALETPDRPNPRPSGPLEALQRGYALFTGLLNSAGTLWVFGFMFLIVADIASNLLFDRPIRGVSEIVSMSIVGCVFLQLANTLHVGRMTRADMIIGWMEQRIPRAAALYNLVFNLVGAAVFAILVQGTLRPFERAWARDEFIGVEGDFTAPVWPVKLIILIGASATALQFLLLALASAQRLFGARERSAAPLGRATSWPPILGLVLFGLAVVALFGMDLSPTAIGLLSIFGMLVLIYAGMPIGVALIVLSFLGIWLLKGNTRLATNAIALAASGTIDKFVFGVVPLFVLMGLLVSVSDIGRDTFAVARWALRRIAGGLGIATVAANAVFAAITGVSIASAAVFTKVAVPQMIDNGYRPKFAVGVVAGSSVLGMLIPPSLLLIIYGVLAEVSVGSLFIAAALPGIILASAFCIGILLMARFWPAQIGELKPQGADGGAADETWGSAARKVSPIVLLIGLVLGGIYGGFFSPTEAGAAGAFGALVIALVKRRLTWGKLWKILVETGHVSVSILFLIIAASIYSRMLTLTGIPQGVAGFITEADLGFYGFLAIYLVIVVAMGMILDSTSIMLILLPLTLPVVTGFGADLIWFGIVTVIAVEIGLLTPPLGITVYVVKATLDRQDITLNEIFAGAFPFVVIMVLVTLLLIALPELSLAFL
ncbi:MAG: hypothetical protein Kilf2KO_05580 [Rhodospirillales bacterium]